MRHRSCRIDSTVSGGRLSHGQIYLHHSRYTPVIVSKCDPASIAVKRLEHCVAVSAGTAAIESGVAVRAHSRHAYSVGLNRASVGKKIELESDERNKTDRKTY